MPRYRSLIAVVLTAVALTGCGAAEKLSPRVAVRDAAHSTAGQKEGTFTLSLVGSEADVNALLNEGAKLTEDDRKSLNLLRTGHITLSMTQGRFGLDVKAGDLDHAFELRFIDKKLYIRGDVAGIAKLAGASPEQINEVVSGLSSQAGFGFLTAAAQGRWLSADFSRFGDVFKTLAQRLGGAESTTPTSATAPSGAKPAVPSQFKALRDAIGKALTEDIKIDKLKSDSVGDHYTGTVDSLRSFYAKIEPALKADLGTMLPGGEGLPSASEVPDKPASMDVWVKGGRVARLEIPLAQFSPKPVTSGPVALRIDIDRQAAGVTAPPDAVEVDVVGLLGKFLGGLGGFLQGVTGAAGGVPG
jgi:hypothetical protein